MVAEVEEVDAVAGLVGDIVDVDYICFVFDKSVVLDVVAGAFGDAFGFVSVAVDVIDFVVETNQIEFVVAEIKVVKLGY